MGCAHATMLTASEPLGRAFAGAKDGIFPRTQDFVNCNLLNRSGIELVPEIC
jgi:hypothetical protein